MALLSTAYVRQEKAAAGVTDAAPSPRFIAESDKFDILASESELQKSWEALIGYCGTLRCEVLNSTINTRTEDTAPNGSITLRVAPDDAAKLFAYIQKVGKIAEHTTQREDKTTAVVDTEAKIKNLTGFRDNLRNMLSKPSSAVKDLLEIQQQLTQVQWQLDAETMQRKILANETEKVAVDLTFRVERGFANTGSFAQIRNALHQASFVLAESIASLITVVVAILSWLASGVGIAHPLLSPHPRCLRAPEFSGPKKDAGKAGARPSTSPLTELRYFGITSRTRWLDTTSRISLLLRAVSNAASRDP